MLVAVAAWPFLVPPALAQKTPATPSARTASKPAAKATPKTKTIKPRRRVRPAAGQSSARPVPVPEASDAATARAYRKDAARHLYSLNLGSIYKGRMPPLLYAVGVLQVHVDRQGRVGTISWMRAPSHAPEVMRAIERLVRAAEPFPPPALVGGLIYTDTWLWHKSGKWQLDTLTEGQD
ncbi:hypothetical protein [Ottowia testudinis]|uniref:TonB C-terminal domain-containing protein n=1 Tax=Ottowia testudinis TaxID=2816950 RepID=A0A975CMP3_9BURK|nr:hypothetical protein [Ottowia testudinis]QTD47009.1 hypothetical protein J1M35_09150 [Ottowia testudinis]